MTLASFFDPNGNGWDITDVAAILGLIIAGGGVFILVRKSAKSIGAWIVCQVREIVKDELALATAPIQPTANGGLSLPDVAKTSARNEAMLRQVAKHLGIDLDEDEAH